MASPMRSFKSRAIRSDSARWVRATPACRHPPRHSRDRARYQDGFKAHVSFEPETGLFTAVALTGGEGNGPGNYEAAVAAGLLAGGVVFGIAQGSSRCCPPVAAIQPTFRLVGKLAGQTVIRGAWPSLATS
jgi:hypothetical protein